MKEVFCINSLILTSLVHNLIKAYSFKDDFIKYCELNENKDDVFITWRDLKEYIQENGWSWSNFIKEKLSILMQSFGYIATSEIKELEVVIEDLDDFKNFLDLNSSSEVFIGKDLLNKYLNNGINNVKTNITNKIDQKALEVKDFKCFKEIKISESIQIKLINFFEPHSEFNSISYESLYRTIFYRFREELINNFWSNLQNKPKIVENFSDFEVNERVFLVGVVTQQPQSMAHLHHIKIILANYHLKCQIVVLLSVANISSNEFPLGIVIGLTGKITDLKFGENWSNIAFITSESWSFPPFGYKTSKMRNLPMNESWVAVFGSLGEIETHKTLEKYLHSIESWILKQHKEFRIGYIIFLGGILSRTQVSLRNDNFISPKTIYDNFYTFLERIPDNIQVFILPGDSDFVKIQVPLPAIQEEYQYLSKNVHFLTNPSTIVLEGKVLLLYNPFHFFELKSYKNDPEKFVVDLLNFKYLNPQWQGSKSITDPVYRLCFIIENELDFFLLHHPSSSLYSAYNDIQTALIADVALDNIPVLVFNLHSQKHFKQKILL